MTALVLLTALNFVNYIDRYILPGVQEQVKGDFHLSDAQIGSLTTCFMLAYMAASPVTGWIGDRFPRKPLIVAAALFWSGINFFTATVHTYFALNLRHAALGLGEASFGIFAPAVLADYFGPAERNKVLTIFNVAIPVGAALGYLVGGTVGQKFGWRMSFVVSAVPGVILALLIGLFMKEPIRGENQRKEVRWTAEAIRSLLKNKAYLSSVLGYAAVTFSLGGISWWMPSFLQRVTGRTESSSAFLMGAITVVAGLGGTIAGGALAQKMQHRTSKALYLVPAFSALAAVPPALCCFFGGRLIGSQAMVIPGLTLAIFLIFLGTGPVNAATVNAVGPGIRASALAGQLFVIHALGDAISPTIIGAVSDHSGLSVGLGCTLITLVLASIIFCFGARYAPSLQREDAAAVA